MNQFTVRRSTVVVALFLGFGVLVSDPSIGSAWGYQASATDTVQAERISEFIAAQDWLGPVSAIALSPFFGLACLSGIATYGPDWIRNSALVSVSGPLNNPVLFWIMSFFTVATSLPRWTKFSKPIAMALEKLEAYSAVIILIAIRVSSSSLDTLASPEVVSMSPVLYEAGIASLPFEILLSIALAINLIVVHTVKIVIDFLVWLTPIPSIDIALEGMGKGLAAFLIGLFAYSPFLATFINFLIFFVCSMVFFKAKRLMVYFREIYIRPTLQKVLGTSPSTASMQCVFLLRPWNGYPRRTRARWVSNPNGKTIQLFITRWFVTREFELKRTGKSPKVGLLSDTLSFETSLGPVVLEARKGLFSAAETAITTPIPEGA